MPIHTPKLGFRGLSRRSMKPLKGTDSCNNTLFEKLNIKVVPKL